MEQPLSGKDQFFNPLSVPAPQATVTELPKKKVTINKKILLVFFFLAVLAGLIYGLNKYTGLFSKAGGECIPQNVRTVDLTGSSVDITFQTDEACQAEVAYGTGNQTEALLLRVPEAMVSLNHRVRLTPLLPATTYYYQIKIDNKPVGEIYSFLTLASSGAVVPVATKRPTVVPTTVVPTTIYTMVYTFEDFQAKFGTTEPVFDTDKNGVVNVKDWLEYEKTKPTQSLP